MAQNYPDVLVCCVGGGSNFGGFIYPFVKDKLEEKEIDIIAVEPKACLTLTNGQYKYDFGDTVGLTPLLKMFTLGNKFVPLPIHAGGFRYHGMSPVISLLAEKMRYSGQLFCLRGQKGLCLPPGLSMP